MRVDDCLFTLPIKELVEYEEKIRKGKEKDEEYMTAMSVMSEGFHYTAFLTSELS